MPERRKSDRVEIVLIAISALSSMAAMLAIVLSLVAISGRIHRIQVARHDSAYDTCHLIQSAILHAVTPSANSHALTQYLGIANCHTYSLHVGIVEKHHHK